MKKSRYLITALGMGLALTFAGCSTEEKTAAEAAPTAAPTATPTAAPVTTTPAPTATPAPRVIGVKNSQSKFVYLTNSLSEDVREIYLMNSGAGDWGKNLIPAESTVKTSEQVQMFYTPQSAASADTAAEDGSTEQSSSSEAVYDMKLVTGAGNSYEIYSIPLGDMEKASLSLDQDTSAAYLRYMSLSEKNEKDTKENVQQYSDSSDDSSYDESSSDSYDDSSYDDSGDYYDDSYDNSGYEDEEGTSTEEYYYGYDYPYDEYTYDPGEEYYDEGGDGSYDDDFDDGGYVDEDGNDGDYYDTEE